MPDDATTTGPREETAAALQAVHTRFGFETAPQTGTGWHPFAELTDGRVARWAAEMTAEGRAPAEVGASLASGLTGPVVRPLAVGFVLLARIPVVTTPTVAVRRRGRVTDRAALTGALALLPDDPAAGRPGTVVVEDLRGELASRLTALAAPLLDEIHRATRYGLRNLWGGLGDVLSSHSLWAARHRGDDPPALHAVFDTVQDVWDLVTARTGIPVDRPVPFPVAGPARRSLGQVRGTCCLHYRIPGRTAADGSPRYCTSCPLISTDERRTRMRHLVEPTATTSRTAHLGMPSL
ncbi:hypothetical protein GCM10009836_54570 [Pseudonocardia ailaonensis]|uniref:Ferric siderophore reductase C-terminal domain-containing protein n=1 Tax=Pseudonocardia ailaonensis TaxID=367279 RepID=A0ABN2NGP2_9PSEU